MAEFERAVVGCAVEWTGSAAHMRLSAYSAASARIALTPASPVM